MMTALTFIFLQLSRKAKALKLLIYIIQGSYGHGKPGKVKKSWNFKMVISRSGKLCGKKFYHKRFGKVTDICDINMFICTEFEIIITIHKQA